jgi:hypothetical protein
MKYYNRLSLEERGNINHCLKLGMNITKFDNLFSSLFDDSEIYIELH